MRVKYSKCEVVFELHSPGNLTYLHKRDSSRHKQLTLTSTLYKKTKSLRIFANMPIYCKTEPSLIIFSCVMEITRYLRKKRFYSRPFCLIILTSAFKPLCMGRVVKCLLRYHFYKNSQALKRETWSVSKSFIQ